jgi:uncharacterized protein YndB with AHSA1/START domain
VVHPRPPYRAGAPLVNLTDTYLVSASLARVWAAVSSPKAMPGWNPKTKRIWPEDAVFDPRRVYDVKYGMSGKVSDFKARVEALVPFQRIAIAYEAAGGSAFNATARESFDLEADPGGGTRVTHHVQIDAEHLPWWARALIWFVSTTGKRVGEPALKEYLDRTA